VRRAFRDICDTLQGAGRDEKRSKQKHYNHRRYTDQQIKTGISSARRTRMWFVVGQRFFV